MLRPILVARCLLLLIILPSCTKETSEVDFGVQPDHASFVPARIALLKCRSWPNGARYKNHPLTNYTNAEQNEVCKEFDSFVLRGFEGQPYMRGISPKAVERALKRKKGDDFIEKIDSLWAHSADDCKDCEGAPAFYTKSISDRKEWRIWLAELSRATKNADALLLPLLTYGYKRTYDDRGIKIAQKVAGISLFLVDTNSGYLLWAGGRKAEASNQTLAPDNATQDPAPPKWSQLHERLFIEEVWKEFPGRQVYH